MKPMATRVTATDPSWSMLAHALWPCVFYFCCSFAMNMLTKLLLTTYQWRAIYTLGAVQNLFTMTSIIAYRACSAVRAMAGYGVPADPCVVLVNALASEKNKKPLSQSAASVAKVVVPLVALHIGNMVFGFAAMRIVNMPMYLVLRRLTTLKVLLIEWVVLRKQLSSGIKLALLVSTTGSVIAGSTDGTFTPVGYALVLLQNVCSACSLTFSKECALPSQQIVLLNSVAGSLICSWLAYTFEYDAVMQFPLLHNARFAGTTFLMCCVCVLYQFAIMICTIRNSALATSVTGNIKDLVSTVCGFLFFPDVRLYVANIAGVGVSLAGAYTFSYLKYLALVQTVDVMPPVASRSTQIAVTASRKFD